MQIQAASLKPAKKHEEFKMAEDLVGMIRNEKGSVSPVSDGGDRGGDKGQKKEYLTRYRRGPCPSQTEPNGALRVLYSISGGLEDMLGIKGKGKKDILGAIKQGKVFRAERRGILITEIKNKSDARKTASLQQQQMMEEIRQSYKGKNTYCITPIPIPVVVQPEKPKVNTPFINEIKDDLRDDKNPTLDVGKISTGYQLLVTEDSVDNPFIIDSELVKTIRKHTRNCSDDYDKAYAIFDWFQKNIKYGEGKRGWGIRYKNSKEVLKTKEGVCGEMAYLYITMARSVGLKSNYASVKVDDKGKKVHHGCAAVSTNKGRILVDPAYHTFDIHHRSFNVLSDSEAIQRYKEWRY